MGRPFPQPHRRRLALPEPSRLDRLGAGASRGEGPEGRELGPGLHPGTPAQREDLPLRLRLGDRRTGRPDRARAHGLVAGLYLGHRAIPGQRGDGHRPNQPRGSRAPRRSWRRSRPSWTRSSSGPSFGPSRRPTPQAEARVRALLAQTAAGSLRKKDFLIALHPSPRPPSTGKLLEPLGSAARVDLLEEKDLGTIASRRGTSPTATRSSGYCWGSRPTAATSRRSARPCVDDPGARPPYARWASRAADAAPAASAASWRRSPCGAAPGRPRASPEARSCGTCCRAPASGCRPGCSGS